MEKTCTMCKLSLNIEQFHKFTKAGPLGKREYKTCRTCVPTCMKKDSTSVKSALVSTKHPESKSVKANEKSSEPVTKAVADKKKKLTHRNTFNILTFASPVKQEVEIDIPVKKHVNIRKFMPVSWSPTISTNKIVKTDEVAQTECEVEVEETQPRQIFIQSTETKVFDIIVEVPLSELAGDGYYTFNGKVVSHTRQIPDDTTVTLHQRIRGGVLQSLNMRGMGRFGYVVELAYKGKQRTIPVMLTLPTVNDVPTTNASILRKEFKNYLDNYEHLDQGSDLTSYVEHLRDNFGDVHVIRFTQLETIELEKEPLAGTLVIDPNGTESHCVALGLHRLLIEFTNEWTVAQMLKFFPNPTHTAEDIIKWRNRYMSTLSLSFMFQADRIWKDYPAPGNKLHKIKVVIGHGHMWINDKENRYTPYEKYVKVDESELGNVEGITAITDVDMDGLFMDIMEQTMQLPMIVKLNDRGYIMGFKHPEKAVYFESAGDDYDERKEVVDTCGGGIVWANQSWAKIGQHVAAGHGIPAPTTLHPEAMKLFHSFQPKPLIQGMAPEPLDVQCIDMSRCYTNALVNAGRIPVPSSLDEPRLFQGVIKPGYYVVNRFWVRSMEVPMMLWPDHMVTTMLASGVISMSDIKYELVCEVAYIKRGTFEFMGDMHKNAANCLTGSFATKRRTIDMSMICTKQSDAARIFTHEGDDMNLHRTMRKISGDLWAARCYSKVEQRETNAHIRAYAVAMGNLRMIQKVVELSDAGVNVCAVRTDAVYFERSDMTLDINGWRYQEVSNVPSCVQNNGEFWSYNLEAGKYVCHERRPYAHRETRWVEKESDGSCLVIGEAGSGKSVDLVLALRGVKKAMVLSSHHAPKALLLRLVDEYNRAVGGVHHPLWSQYVTEPIYAKFDTILACVPNKRNARAPGKFMDEMELICIDEISQTPSYELSKIHQYSEMYPDCVIRCYGDFNQCPPVLDHYYDYMKLQTLKDICNSTLENKTYREGANRYADDGTREALSEFLNTGILPICFRNPPVDTEKHIAHTNTKCVDVNNRFILKPGDLIQMRLGENARRYQQFQVFNKEKYPFIRFDEAWYIDVRGKEVKINKNHARPAFCCTAYAYQGDRIDEDYVIHEASEMSLNELYVCISRASSKKYVHFDGPIARQYSRRNNVIQSVEINIEYPKQSQYTVVECAEPPTIKEYRDCYKVKHNRYPKTEQGMSQAMRFQKMCYDGVRNERVVTKTHYMEFGDESYWGEIPEDLRHEAKYVPEIDGLAFHSLKLAKKCNGKIFEVTVERPWGKCGEMVQTKMFGVDSVLNIIGLGKTAPICEILDRRTRLACDIDKGGTHTEDEYAEVIGSVIECCDRVAEKKGLKIVTTKWRILKSEFDEKKPKLSLHISNIGEIFNTWKSQKKFWEAVQVESMSYPCLLEDGRSIIDNIYTTNRALRIIGSTKLHKKNTLVPCDMMAQPLEHYIHEEYLVHECGKIALSECTKLVKQTKYRGQSKMVGKGKRKTRKRIKKTNNNKNQEEGNFNIIQVGDVYRLERVYASECPCCQRTHTNDNMFWSNGELRCFRGGQPIKMAKEEMMKL